MKKFISILLVFAMLFTLTNAVYANQEENLEEETPLENVKGEIITLYDRGNSRNYDVIVITFDEKYTQKSDSVSVFLDVYKSGSTTEISSSYVLSTADRGNVSVEIFEYEGKKYPQIFINIPIAYQKSNAYPLQQTVIRLNSGVFSTDDGEKSDRVELPYTSCNRDKSKEKFRLTCTGDKITKVTERLGRDYIYLLQNSTVTAEGKVSNSEYADVWAANSKINFYYVETLLENTGNTIKAENLMDYTVEFKLCDAVCAKKTFYSVPRVDTYFEKLGESAELFLLSPIALVVCVIMLLFVPGLGMVVGPPGISASFYHFFNFFVTLFGGNIAKEYTF